jgi:hypothetical protein
MAAATFLQKQSNICRELTLLSTQEKIISEDMENEMEVKKRRQNVDEPDVELFERAYTADYSDETDERTCQTKEATLQYDSIQESCTWCL